MHNNNCLIAISILLIINSASCKSKIADDRPDVIVVLVDALRADHLPIYGYPLNTSPYLDEWAKSGIVFKNAYTQSTWTKSSVASLFTSTYVSVHGVYTSPDLDNPERPFNEKDVLSPHAVTLAEALQESGYSTAAFTTNYHIVPMAGFAQGFDEFNIVDIDWMTHKAGDKINKEFADWLAKRDTAKPYFAYLHYMDVHGPYLPPEQFKNAFMEYHERNGPRILNDEEFEKLQYMKLDERDMNKYIAWYDAQILYWDGLFKQLMEHANKTGRRRNLMVIVIADHGEQFMEHGHFDHGYSLHIEETHVPLIISMPKNITPGVDERPVMLIDLAPTILAIARINPPKQYQGLDLFDRKNANLIYRNVVSEIRVPKRAEFIGLMDNDKKWIFDLSAMEITSVYDIKTDPTEMSNIISTIDSQTLVKKRTWFIEWLEETSKKRIPPAKVPPNMKLDKKSIEALRGLGYVQ